MPADESHSEWQVTWGLRALNAAAGYLSDDREGVAGVMAVSRELETQPLRPDAFPLGSPTRLRLHVGRYRIVYQVDEQDRLVTIVRLGRLA